MPTILLDLAGRPEWNANVLRDRITHVRLAELNFWAGNDRSSLIVDGRGRHEEAVELLQKLNVHPPRTVALLTDRERPEEHAAAYLAGVTRVVVLEASSACTLDLFQDLETELSK